MQIKELFVRENIFDNVVLLVNNFIPKIRRILEEGVDLKYLVEAGFSSVPSTSSSCGQISQPL